MSAMKSATETKIEAMNAAQQEAAELYEEAEALREQADALEEQANETARSEKVYFVPFEYDSSRESLGAGAPLEWHDDYKPEQKHIRPAAEELGIPVKGGLFGTILTFELPMEAVDDARDGRLTGFVGAAIVDADEGELLEWWHPSELEEEFGILCEDKWGRETYLTQETLDELSDDDYHQYTPVEGGEA